MRTCLIYFAASALATTLLAGCSLFEQNPYADFRVGQIDEERQQTPAVILLGDPQVSSRESLINDRMREVDHLENMISKSENEAFEPQLKRDLRVISALTAQLGISFNPASGLAFEREDQINRLRTDIELTKLRNELERLQELPSPAPNGASGQTAGINNSDPPQNQPHSEMTEPNLSEVRAQLGKAAKAAEDLIKELHSSAGRRAKDAAIKISPEDHFEDLNSYRARLRHRQNEVRLDDVHDADGHALYRLQLTAAVLPGEVKNKFAVLDVGIAPLKIEDKDIRALFERWLVELSRRGLRLALSGAVGSKQNSCAVGTGSDRTPSGQIRAPGSSYHIR